MGMTKFPSLDRLRFWCLILRFGYPLVCWQSKDFDYVIVNFEAWCIDLIEALLRFENLRMLKFVFMLPDNNVAMHCCVALFYVQV